LLSLVQQIIYKKPYIYIEEKHFILWERGQMNCVLLGIAKSKI